ncbi:MAG: O-antigen ligase family protein [candidate division Zixibacteria bacterium]
MTSSKDTFSRMPDRQLQAAPKLTWLYLLIITASLAGGVGLVIGDQTVVFAIILSVLGMAMIILYPFCGLIIFVILNFIRPTDIMPALAVIPLAKIIGGATLIALIFSRIRSRDFELGGRQAVLLIAFAATLFISVPLSFWPTKSLDVSLDFLKIILFYLLFVNIVRDLKKLRTITLIAIACIVVLCLSTIYSFISGDIRAGSLIGQGMFGDANDVALILVTAIPLTIFYKLKNTPVPYYKIIQWGVIVLLILGVVMTKSRGGLLGLLAVVFFMAMKGKNKAIGLVVFLVVIALILMLLPSEFTDRYSTIGTYNQDASAMGRIYAWQAGINMMIARPVTGVGVGCFETAFGLAFRPAGFGAAKWQAPHNTLIQVGGETGLIGLAIFMYLYLYCLMLMRRLQPAGTDEQKKKITLIKDAIFTGLIGFGVSAFFLTQAFNYMLYFLIASTASLTAINSQLMKTTDNNKIENTHASELKRLN